MPKDYNKSVMKIKRLFDEEVKLRAAEREQKISLTTGQKYALRELRIIFASTEDEDKKAQLNILEKAFRLPVILPVNRELNFFRRNGITGGQLESELTRVYHHFQLGARLDRQAAGEREVIIPKIICSEALL